MKKFEWATLSFYLFILSFNAQGADVRDEINKLKKIVAIQLAKIEQLTEQFVFVSKKIESMSRYQNVRTIVTKTEADKYCQKVFPGSKAAHVPFSYVGKTGETICNKNRRDERTCTGALFVYVRNNNGIGDYKENDRDCKAELRAPWPWGIQYDRPNTLASEWGHGNVHVVCCK